MNEEMRQDLRDQIRQKPEWFDWSEPEKPDYDEDETDECYENSEKQIVEVLPTFLEIDK